MALPILVDDWHIDFALGGSQKVLSCSSRHVFHYPSAQMPGRKSKPVNYDGYDALLPFHDAQKNFYFPYTPHWHGISGNITATKLILDEGLQNVFIAINKSPVSFGINPRKLDMNYFPPKMPSHPPTVTALNVPE